MTWCVGVSKRWHDDMGKRGVWIPPAPYLNCHRCCCQFHCYCHCHLINFKKCYKYHLYSVTTLFLALSLEDSPKHKIARLWFWMKLWTWTANENLQVWLNLLNKMLWTKVLGDGARSMHFTIKIRWDKDNLIMLNCSLTGSMRESLTWSVNWKLKRRNQP